jgi:hypothetical protein
MELEPAAGPFCIDNARVTAPAFDTDVGAPASRILKRVDSIHR